MVYEKQIWQDLPDKTTPITAERLNHMEDGIDVASQRTEWLITDHGVLPSTLTSAGQQAPFVAAVAALSALGGGVLRIPDRTRIVFTDEAVLGSTISNVRIIGGSGSVIAKSNPDANFLFSLRWIDSSFENITFDFGPRNYVDNATFTAAINGIQLTNGKRDKFLRCKFINGARTLTLVGTASGGGCDDVLIEGCNFGSTRDIAINVGQGFEVAPARNIRVYRNVFTEVLKATTLGDPWTAILMRAVGFDIEGNRILASADTAIMLTTGASDFSVRGNYVRTQQVGIYLGVVANGTVSGNDITSTNDIGIAVNWTGGGSTRANVAISGNNIKDTARNGILVEGTNQIVIASNVLQGCAWKVANAQGVPVPDNFRSVIGVQSSPGSTSDTVTIVGNTIDNTVTTGAPLHAISVDNGPSNLIVAENNVGGSPFGGSRFYYVGLTGTYEVQTDTTQTNSTKKYYLPRYETLISKTPAAGAKCWHATLGELFGDGTAWIRVLDGYPAPGTEGTTTTKTQRKLTLPNYANLAGITPTVGAMCWHDTHGLMVGNGTVWKQVALGTTVTP